MCTGVGYYDLNEKIVKIAKNPPNTEEPAKSLDKLTISDCRDLARHLKWVIAVREGAHQLIRINKEFESAGITLLGGSDSKKVVICCKLEFEKLDKLIEKHEVNTAMSSLYLCQYTKELAAGIEKKYKNVKVHEIPQSLLRKYIEIIKYNKEK